MYIETFNRVILHGEGFVQMRLVSEKTVCFAPVQVLVGFENPRTIYLFNYAACNPEAEVIYRASDMIL